MSTLPFWAATTLDSKANVHHTKKGDAGDCQHQVEEGEYADEVEAKRVIHHFEKGAVKNPAKLCGQSLLVQRFSPVH